MVRKLGIRHLVVVNIHNNVVGMITRKNLVTLETERHSFKEVAIKQKPTFFKAKFHKTVKLTNKKIREKATLDQKAEAKI